jgi:hypothetical protein
MKKLILFLFIALSYGSTGEAGKYCDINIQTVNSHIIDNGKALIKRAIITTGCYEYRRFTKTTESLLNLEGFVITVYPTTIEVFPKQHCNCYKE